MIHATLAATPRTTTPLPNWPQQLLRIKSNHTKDYHALIPMRPHPGLPIPNNQDYHALAKVTTPIINTEDNHPQVYSHMNTVGVQ